MCMIWPTITLRFHLSSSKRQDLLRRNKGAAAGPQKTKAREQSGAVVVHRQSLGKEAEVPKVTSWRWWCSTCLCNPLRFGQHENCRADKFHIINIHWRGDGLGGFSKPSFSVSLLLP